MGNARHETAPHARTHPQRDLQRGQRGGLVLGGGSLQLSAQARQRLLLLLLQLGLRGAERRVSEAQGL